jgi:phage tail tape-measure protein
MDILEMAAWGAAAGSVVPGVGTLVGAGIGAAAGVATEAWQYFNSDDSGSVVPSETIDKPGAVVTGGQSGAVVSNNIDVTVNVDPDMVATNVDVDGESYEVTERGLQSGTA